MKVFVNDSGDRSVGINPNNSEVYECLRCKKNYCNNCNTSVEIDFDVNAEEDSIVTKGDDVCPFCYNQLGINGGDTYGRNKDLP